MSLYRAWRPRTFADLVGQDAVVRTLTTAIDTGRLAHAYLFSGPRGSGKTSAAKILARCIECVLGPTSAPDNTCENCRAILDGTALDVLEIDAASNRGIDEIRALRDAVKFAPSVMRRKVYIIDEAHMLTKEGANAFLKTLEEPPEWAVFVLATTAPEALPPTILSRCQRYAFRRIPIATMIERMRVICAAEKISADDAALAAIAYRADGGLRDALTMLEQVAAFAGAAGATVDAATVDAAFGHTARADAVRLRDAALDGDAAAVLAVVDEATEGGADLATLLRATLAEFRHLLVARVNPDLLARDLAADDARDAVARAATVAHHRLTRALRLLADAQAAARGSGNARLELETALLRFVLQTEDPALDALAARLAALEAGDPQRRSADAPAISPAPVEAPRRVPNAPPPAPAPAAAPARVPAAAPEAPPPKKAAEPPAAAATGGLDVRKVRSLWDGIRKRAEEQRKSLSSGLGRAQVTSLDGTMLTLTVPDPIAADVLKSGTAVLREAVADATGVALDVRVHVERAAARSAEPDFADTGGPAANDDLQRYAFEKLL